MTLRKLLKQYYNLKWHKKDKNLKNKLWLKRFHFLGWSIWKRGKEKEMKVLTEYITKKINSETAIGRSSSGEIRGVIPIGRIIGFSRSRKVVVIPIIG